MSTHPPIASLVPHAGRMCLLEEVVAWDAQRVHCRTGSHRAEDHPLRCGGRLRALHLCEYGAQAMAVHGGLLALAQGRAAPPGMLAALRGVRLAVQRIDTLEGTLDIEAERLLAGRDGWLYAFRATHRGQWLAEGRATVMHPATEPLP